MLTGCSPTVQNYKIEVACMQNCDRLCPPFTLVYCTANWLIGSLDVEVARDEPLHPRHRFEAEVYTLEKAKWSLQQRVKELEQSADGLAIQIFCEQL